MILGTKCFQFPFSKKIVKVAGYEPFALKKLLRDGVDEQELLRGFVLMPTISYYFDHKQRKYYPDIFIPAQNRIIEVKSLFTFRADYEKNLAKMQATSRHGYQTELHIYDQKGNLIECLNKF